MNILQYESKIWATADLLRGSGIKESEWPSYMMPFFALAMIESRLVRMFDDLKTEIGEEAFANIDKDDLYDMIKDQGYRVFYKNILALSLHLLQTLSASFFPLRRASMMIRQVVRLYLLKHSSQSIIY
jgi:hypothetical protein